MNKLRNTIIWASCFFLAIPCLSAQTEGEDINTLIKRYYNYGRKASDQDKKNEALAWFQSILVQDPYREAGLIMAGNMCGELELYASAIDYYKKAIKEYDSQIAYSNLGIAYGTIGYDDLTIDCANHLDNKRAVSKYIYIGGIAARHSQYDKAIEYMHKAINIKQDDYTAWFNLGVIYTDLNQLDKAIESYNKAIEANPKHISSYLGKAEVLQKMGKPQSEYADLCNKAIGLLLDDKNSFWTISKIAKAHKLLGNEKTSNACMQLKLEKLNKFVELYPDSYIFYTERAETYEDLKNDKAAILDYEQAFKINPEYKRVKDSLSKLKQTTHENE